MGYSLKSVLGYKVIGKIFVKTYGGWRYVVERNEWDLEMGATFRWCSIDKHPYEIDEGGVVSNPVFRSGVLKKAKRGKYLYHYMLGEGEWSKEGDYLEITEIERFDQPFFIGVKELLEDENFEGLSDRDKIWLNRRREWELDNMSHSPTLGIFKEYREKIRQEQEKREKDIEEEMLETARIEEEKERVKKVIKDFEELMLDGEGKKYGDVVNDLVRLNRLAKKMGKLRDKKLVDIVREIEEMEENEDAANGVVWDEEDVRQGLFCFRILKKARVIPAYPEDFVVFDCEVKQLSGPGSLNVKQFEFDGEEKAQKWAMKLINGVCKIQ